MKKGKRPALITPIERERNQAIGLLRQVVALIEGSHPNRDAILLSNAREHLRRLEMLKLQDLAHRRVAIAKATGSAGQ